MVESRWLSKPLSNPQPQRFTFPQLCVWFWTGTKNCLLEKRITIYYTISMQKRSFESVVWKEGKYFVAQCLNVDVSSFGKTKQGALKNLKEALELYFEDSRRKQISKIERPVIVRHQLQHA